MAGKLKLSEMPEKPWTYLTVDFIMKLLVVARKDVILVVCDWLNVFQFSRLLDVLYEWRAQLHESDHHCLECLEIFDFFTFFDQACSTIKLSWLTTRSSLLVSLMFVVSSNLKLEMMSLINLVSWSLLGIMVSLDVCMISSMIGMLIESGAWSEKSRKSGRIECLSSSCDPCQRNMRLIMKLDSPAVSEYLVRHGLVGEDKERSKESAIIIKSSLIEEWKGNDGSYKLSLMLKSFIMRRTLLMLTSVFFRYFKAEWDESE